MRFHMLGPLLVTAAGGRRVRLCGPRQEKVVAALLLDANHAVSIDRLAEVVWGERVPATGRRQVQDLVSRLRRLLGEVEPGTEPLHTERDGYRLEVTADQLDALEFDRLVRSVGPPGRPGAAATLRRAVALWRGATLAGMDAPALRSAIARWDDQRVAVWEECLALEVAGGGPVPARVVDELTQLTAVDAYRERPVELLMVALHGQGRTAEAVNVFRRFRRQLLADVGTEPGPALTAVHERIVGGGASAELPPRRRAERYVHPAQLPAALTAFAGRATALGELEAARAEVGVAVVSGPPSVGKTALVVRWAHRNRARFPDGQLFIDLHGDGERVTAQRALRRFLRALGVPADGVPDDVDEAAAMYRTALDGRRMLVVLDNAADAEQVLPLLPGEPRCFTAITSRDGLPHLVARCGARMVRLDMLSVPDAERLLLMRLGRRRLVPADLTALVEACGGGPSALSIAAARLAADPRLTPAALAEQLRAARPRPRPLAASAAPTLKGGAPS